MKNVVLTLAAAALVAPLAGHANPPNSVGCGLGSKLFDGQSGVAPQVLAVTTNGTLGNQTFGITSGTLGCDSDGTVVASQRVPVFVAANLDRLAGDMAGGGGETLESLAVLLNIEERDRAPFFSTVRVNFERIVTSPDVSAGELLDGLYMVMAEDATLSRYVGT